ncbi:hypothetical protein ACQY0O_008402 [Thecaphora frezii]
MPATRATGIQASNIIEGSRKRSRPTNESGDDATPTVAVTGTIERRINSLSQDQIIEHGFSLLNALMEARDPSDGTLLCEPFLKLPSKRQYPDYYEIIKKPLTLEDVRQKLQQKQYASLPEVKHDCEIICNNAKRYNLKESEIWQQARELHSVVKLTYVAIVESLPEPAPAADKPLSTAAPGSTTSSAAAQTVKEEVRSSPRPKRIMLRPTRSQARLSSDAPAASQKPSADPVPASALAPTPAPVIASVSSPAPSALAISASAQQSAVDVEVEAPKTVATNGNTAQPTSGADSETHADPGAGGAAEAEGEEEDMDVDGEADSSHRADHARTESPADHSGMRLTKQGLLDGRKRPGKRGKRLKATLRGLIAALRKVVNKQGLPITQHFDELPSQSDYPDYYAAIQQPISLAMIERRVYDKEYINAHALFLDLELMLDNAQYYNEEGSETWNDAQEIRNYLETVAIPSLIADGFTLEKDDLRQSALPLHLAANSTIEAHKAAYRLLVAKSQGLDPNSDHHGVASASPEPSGPKLRLGSGITQNPLLLQSHAVPTSHAVPSGSASPMGSHMSTPLPGIPPLAMSPHAVVQPFSMTSPANVMPPPPPSGMHMGALTPPHPSQTMATVESSTATPSRTARSTRSAKPTHFVPTTPGSDSGQAQRGTDLDYSVLPRLPVDGVHGTPNSPWTSADMPGLRSIPSDGSRASMRPASPQKPSKPLAVAAPARPIPFEGKKRLPLISHFNVDVHVESEGGRAMLCPPGLRLHNEFVKQHSVHLSPSTTLLMLRFPLKTLRRASKVTAHTAGGSIVPEPQKDAEDAPADKVAGPGGDAAGPRQTREQRDADEDSDDQDAHSLTWPWWPQLAFNGKEIGGSWSGVSGAKPATTDGGAKGKVELSYCKVRLLPKKGLNVFELKLRPDESCEALQGLPAERYCIYFSC